MKERVDLSKKLYEFRDFIEHNVDIILAVNMNDGMYEQIVYRRPDFYSASERGDAVVLYESVLPLLPEMEEGESVIFSPESIGDFYRSPKKSLSSQKIKLSHRNGARWIKAKLIKSDNYPEYVFVCIKEITYDGSFWDINDLMRVVGDKYTSILSVNVTLNECHLVTSADVEDYKKGQNVASYTKFLDALASGAASAYRNEIKSKLSQTFLLAKSRADYSLEKLEYPDESGEHWYSLEFEYVRSMLSDNVCGLLFIACIDDAIKEKRDRANLTYQLFTIGHRLFKMYVSVDLDSDRYLINLFDGDKRFDSILDGCYSQNVGSIFKYVPENERRRIITESSLEKLKDRVYDGDFTERSYSFSSLDRNGVKREIEVIVGVTAAEERAGAFIAVRDVTEQNILKRTEEREKEIINLLGKNYNIAFTMDIATFRLSYLKRPSVSKNVFQENGDYKTLVERLSELYIPEEDQDYVITMTRPETVLKEVRKNGFFRFSHKWKKEGKFYWAEWTITPISSDPNILLGQARNVTEEYAAELRRLRSEAELRQLKIKNDELTRAATRDEFGLDNLTAFEEYKKNNLGGGVAYLTFKDWYRYYLEGSFAGILGVVRKIYSPAKIFRLGGGDIVMVLKEEAFYNASRAFADYAEKEGIAYEIGFSAEKDLNTAVKTAYDNKKRN